MVRVALSLLGVIAAVISIYYLSRDLVPPRTLVFAAGAEGGGYHRFAERYRTILAQDDIEMTVMVTEGSVDNARLLAEGIADAGLLQGGIEADEALETLGAVFLEPIFIFVRAEADVPKNPVAWRGLRIASGTEGSGTRSAVEDLVRAARLDRDQVTLLPLGGKDAADAILAGGADAAVFVAPVDAPYLAPLFASDAVRIVELDHLVTLSRRLPDSSVTALPSGAFSLDPPIPAQRLPMLTLAANIVAQSDLHPALVDRLVEAARRVHGRRDILSDDAQFPTMSLATLPKDPYARDLIRDGPSPLVRFLPYWVVAQISRFAILLLPILFILVPLLRALPALYVFRQRRRVFRHYAAIRSIDSAVADTSSPEDLRELGRQLDEIDDQIARLRLPLAYREYAYTTRLHIDLIRNRITDKKAAALRA